jgi:hypothetical protein
MWLLLERGTSRKKMFSREGVMKVSTTATVHILLGIWRLVLKGSSLYRH